MRHSATHYRRAAVTAPLLLAMLIATVSHAPPAHASETTETVTVPSQNTDYSEVVSVPQFDQANGVLQSVTIDLIGDIEGIMQIENLSTSSASVGAVTLAATVTITSLADPALTVSPALPEDSEAFTLEIFDGTIDFEGPSGQTFDNLAGTDIVSATFTDPAELAPFIGTGTTEFQVDAIATSNAAATGGNIELVFTTLAEATILITYQFAAPDIAIEKTPDQQTVAFGDDVTFSITVTNTGEVDLTNVIVTDPLAPDCDATIGDLAVGESTTYDCTVESAFADFTNVATTQGEDPIGNIVTDEDDADVNVIAPEIDIEKLPDEQTVGFLEDVTFTIVVTNTGDLDLINVVVTDELAPGCAMEIGDLAIGESVEYECTVPAVEADFTNVAVVEGEDESGNEVSDEDDADVDVLVPDITIEKSPNFRVIFTGDDAVFEITVTNTGEVDLVNVVVSDPRLPGCDRNIGDLAVGESITYTCVATNVTEGFTNVAIADGEDEAGNEVSDSDDAVVEIGLPDTGSDSVELSIAGWIMLLAGGALVLFERKRAAE